MCSIYFVSLRSYLRRLHGSVPVCFQREGEGRQMWRVGMPCHSSEGVTFLYPLVDLGCRLGAGGLELCMVVDSVLE